MVNNTGGINLSDSSIACLLWRGKQGLRVRPWVSSDCLLCVYNFCGLCGM